jgi:hypothetical protein
VATPNVSPPHDATPNPATTANASATDADFDLGRNRFTNTNNNSRACEALKGDASPPPLSHQGTSGGKNR